MVAVIASVHFDPRTSVRSEPLNGGGANIPMRCFQFGLLREKLYVLNTQPERP